MEKVYYVYYHYCLKTENLFYIGKGKGNRAYQTNGRNRFWHNYVKENGYVVKIMHSDLSEIEAYELETKLITENKKNGFLVNIAGVEVFSKIPRPANKTKSQILKENIRKIHEEQQKEDKIIQKAKLAREQKEEREKQKERELSDQRSKVQHEAWVRRKEEKSESYSTRYSSDEKAEVSESEKRQLNYLHSQGKINPYHYYKQRSKW